MDRDRALALVPEAHARAIRLRDAGRERDIAVELDIPPAAVPLLLRVADAKLAALMAAGHPTAAAGTADHPGIE